jgi:hypothetical protein
MILIGKVISYCTLLPKTMYWSMTIVLVLPASLFWFVKLQNPACLLKFYCSSKVHLKCHLGSVHAFLNGGGEYSLPDIRLDTISHHCAALDGFLPMECELL